MSTLKVRLILPGWARLEPGERSWSVTSPGCRLGGRRFVRSARPRVSSSSFNIFIRVAMRLILKNGSASSVPS